MNYSAQETSNNDNNDGVVDENAPLTEAEVTLAGFWPTISDEIKRIKSVDAKNQVLPLARIKKIMKLDEDVKMISAEAPLLFAKAAEIFIHELTLRAWIHTENNKRRTLQRNDIAMAISKFDQFDFLIDIVPREEIKPVRKETPNKTNCDQVQYYLQLAQQHQQALQGTSNIATTPNATVTMPNTNTLNAPTLQNAIQLSNGQLAPITTINTNGTPQNILVTNTGQQISSVGGVVNSLGTNLFFHNFQSKSAALAHFGCCFFLDRWTASGRSSNATADSITAADCHTKRRDSAYASECLFFKMSLVFTVMTLSEFRFTSI